MDHAVTAVIINKTGNDLTSAVGLSGFTPASTAAVYRYSAADLNSIEHLAGQAVSAGGFSALFPGRSITLFVLSPEGSQPTGPPAAPTGLTVE